VPDVPEIAVIVGDYSRRRFVRSALRSLAAQTLPRTRYEIVVTKNYRDEALDRALAEDGATVLFDEEPRIGRWLRRAVNSTRAPIVTFLDDDDEAEPERLAHVLEVFARYPELGFYRNRVSVIDEAGHPVPKGEWRPHEADRAFDSLGPVYVSPTDKARLFDLATRRTHASFNTSSMALRREVLDGDLGDAFERTQLEDLFLFLAGVLAPGGVYLDDRRLTRFRFYAGNVTHQVRWLRHAEGSYQDMAGVAAGYGRADFAEWLAQQSVHYGRMFRGASLVDRVSAHGDRRDVARRTGEYLRYLGRHPKERALTLDTWAAAVYGIAYLGLPGPVARVARARAAARAWF
jgi:glycosyltransferase involved in cell wall biosynthesis